LGAGAQLIRNHVLQLIPEPNQVAPPLLSHFLVVDDQIVDALLAQGGIDRRLVSACRLVSATPRADETDHDARARELLSVRETDGSRPVRLYFQGPRDAGQIECAERLATEAGSPLLIVDVTTLAHSSAPMVDMLPLVFREAVLHGAVIYLDGSDIVVGEHDQTRTALDAEIARHPGITILAGRNDWVSAGPEPLGVVTVNFTIPDPDERQQLWEQALDEVGAHLPRDDITLLASRFNLTRTSIREAALTAHHATRIPASAEWSQEARSQQAPTLPALFAAARSQTGHDLAALARKIDPMYGWDDIVLSTDATAQLHELCDRVIFSERVMRTWGFKRKMSQGTGISALFAGPSGTGKTMAAEVIARAVGLDLFKVDLSSVISKYIGETEKNLEKIFTAAADANAILLFDEAEALFGKRSEIRDSHDRYANIEIAYLLQRMEQFDGVSILTTNLRQHLDDAFTRRLQYVIEFPFPDEAHRRRIWQVSLPADTPYDPAIDFDALAREFRLPGGNIVNVVLAAAYLAAAQDSTIGMPHLLRAIRREYQKMGRVIPTSELDTAGEPS
ncbi:MAG: ATP-binding protein, partial [Candidatus Nanopelagicales bacterium]